MALSKEQVDQLKFIHKCPQKLRKKVLQKVNSQCIKAICECCLNTLKGHIIKRTSEKVSL